MNKLEYDTVMRVINWFEAQAKRDDEQIKTCRFQTLNEAYKADAKNYRTMANDLRKVTILTR